MSAHVLQLILESAELTESLNRRRKKRNHQCAVDGEKLPAQAVDQGLGGMLVAAALRIRLQPRKNNAAVRSRTCKAKSAERKDVFDLFCPFQHGRDLLVDLFGVLQ